MSKRQAHYHPRSSRTGWEESSKQEQQQCLQRPKIPGMSSQGRPCPQEQVSGPPFLKHQVGKELFADGDDRLTEARVWKLQSWNDIAAAPPAASYWRGKGEKLMPETQWKPVATRFQSLFVLAPRETAAWSEELPGSVWLLHLCQFACHEGGGTQNDLSAEVQDTQAEEGILADEPPASGSQHAAIKLLGAGGGNAKWSNNFSWGFTGLRFLWATKRRGPPILGSCHSCFLGESLPSLCKFSMCSWKQEIRHYHHLSCS